MKKIEITLYTIDELKAVNKNAYDSVIEKAENELININFIYAKYNVLETLKEKYNISIEEKNIYYSISYCQGDGFCFIDNDILSYQNIKNNKNCNAFEEWIINNLYHDELLVLLEYLECGYNLRIIKNTSRYNHAYTCEFDSDVYYCNKDEKYNDAVNDLIYRICKKLFDEVYISICDDIEKMLYKYYDVDEEEVINFINDNERLYDKNGVIY